MAITAATKNSDFSGFLPRHIAAPFFETAERNSVLMNLARQVPLGINGESIPVVTARPTADWVAEGATKPASNGTMTLKNMDPKKLACIAVVSQEVVRADPGGYVLNLRKDIGEAFAIAFDYAGFHNLGGAGTGTGPFGAGNFIDATTKSNELGATAQASGGLYVDLVESMDEIITQTDLGGTRKYKVTGFALDSRMETQFRRSVDTTGQPIWTDLPTSQEPDSIMQTGSLMGRRSFMGEGVGTASGSILGYAGDWNQAVWGTIGGISYSVSDQASVTINGSLLSLWENNLFAIRAEAEYGFVVNDPKAFIQLRNLSGS